MARLGSVLTARRMYTEQIYIVVWRRCVLRRPKTSSRHEQITAVSRCVHSLYGWLHFHNSKAAAVCMDILVVRIRGAALSLLIVVNYRPVFTAVYSFFDEFAGDRRTNGCPCGANFYCWRYKIYILTTSRRRRRRASTMFFFWHRSGSTRHRTTS